MTTASTRPKTHAREGDAEGFPRPFGNYILLMAFARGGMGEVYLAKRGAILGAEKYCVLKKLRPELTEDREYVARFIDEARVVVQLNHANICQVFDVGRVGTEYYLAMEYVSGRDVRSVQDRARNLGVKVHEASVLYLLAETLSALDYAHRRTHPMTGEPLNLVHRDVSPQNIMVSFEGEVKLIDFGLASSRLKVERTQPNIVMGKMAYMAPEQARGDGIDRRADLFAAGVVGYELLAGERFYEGMSSQEIWYVVGRGGFVPSKWTELNPDFARILAKALHPDPDSRFSTCAEFRDAVMAYLHTRHPGLGERSLRDLVHELYVEEIQRERDMLLGFAEVSGEIAEDLLESTRSQSVSLAHAGDLLSPSSGGGARIVHDERTVAGASLPDEPPSTQLTNTLTETGSEEDDPPDAPTQLEEGGGVLPPLERTRTPPTGTITSMLADASDETSLGDPVMATHLADGESVEQTAVVVRAPGPPIRTVVDEGGRGVPKAALAAAAVALVVVTGVAVLFLGGGDEATGTEGTAPVQATALPTPTPASAAPVEEDAARDATDDPVVAAAMASAGQAAPSAEDHAAAKRQAEEEAAAQAAAAQEVAAQEVAAAAAQAAAEQESADAEAAARAERAAEARRARDAKRAAAAAKAKEEREAAARRAAEKARERDARRAQTARAQRAAPRESIEEMVLVVMKCDLGPPCAKSGFGGPTLKYKAGSMDAAEKKSFEQLVRKCRKRCAR